MQHLPACKSVARGGRSVNAQACSDVRYGAAGQAEILEQLGVCLVGEGGAKNDAPAAASAASRFQFGIADGRALGTAKPQSASFL